MFLFNQNTQTANNPLHVVDPTPDSGDNKTPYAKLEKDEHKKILQQKLQLEFQKLFEKIEVSSAHSTQLNHQTNPKQPGNSASKQQTSNPKAGLSEKLLRAGISQNIIDRVLYRVKLNQFSLLELRQQAKSEGWIDSPQYIQKSKISGDLTRGIREQFGDRVFDLYLYYSGRPNRIKLKRVPSGSVEENAGLQAGDIIIRYASDNIYSMFELRRAFQSGEAGEIVLLEYLRHGQLTSTTLPRSSLDIPFQMISLNPDS